MAIALSRVFSRAPVAWRCSPARAARRARLQVAAFKDPEDDKIKMEQTPSQKAAEAAVERQLSERQQERGLGMRPAVTPSFRRLNDMIADMQTMMDAVARDFAPPFAEDFFFPRRRGGGLSRSLLGDVLTPGLAQPGAPPPTALPDTMWAANRVDVEETDAAYIVTAEVPGFGKDSIKVQLTPDGVLHLSAELKEQAAQPAEAGGAPQGFVRRLSRFSRTFRLPKDVSADEISASAKDGVLTVTIPKHAKQDAPPREIPVA